jgi:regulatory protein
MMDVPSEIMTKMERFCAFQERCEKDVRRKLTSFRLSEYQEDTVVKSLKDNQFLDENRYAEAFVRGKVRVGWGRQKIVAALRAKDIPSEFIDRHCSAIPAADYEATLRKAIEKWRRTHPDETPNSPKLVRHLLSKGYAMGEVMREVKS